MRSSVSVALCLFLVVPLLFAQPKAPETGTIAAAPVFAGQVSELPLEIAAEKVERIPAIAAGQVGGWQTALDGTRYVVLRFQSGGAPALRLHIQDLRLPADAKLLVYGINDGIVTDVAGPYTGSGPAAGQDFWTDAVRGPEAVVELQAGAELPPDLPFQVTELAWAAGADLQEKAAPDVRTSLFRGQAVTHEVIDGWAVLEGCMVLGRADELLPAGAAPKGKDRLAVGITATRYRWPGGVMPYVIDPALPSPERAVTAVDHWNSVMGGVVKMVPRTGEANYVRFVRAASASTCSSSVGMVGGGQTVNVGDYCSAGNLIHEVGHAWGLFHEHTREDRDRFVKVNFENITSSATYNFYQNVSTSDDLGTYDHGSIMHYGSTAFSANGLPTIETIPAGIPIGQRSQLSTGDINGVKSMYGSVVVAPTPPPPSTTTPPPTQTVQVTIATNPTGQQVKINGVAYTAPVAVSWPIGSTQRVEAVNRTSGSTKYTFQKWSDGGAQAHDVIASSTTTMYKADYTVALKVKASSKGGGAVVLSPPSADEYYPLNSSVAISAIPQNNHCFTGWTNLIAGTPSQTNLPVNKSYEVEANFAPGSISLERGVVYPNAVGGSFTIGFRADSTCTWTVRSSAPWATVTSTTSGSGAGIVSITVEPNTTSQYRLGLVYVGNRAVVVSQAPKR